MIVLKVPCRSVDVAERQQAVMLAIETVVLDAIEEGIHRYKSLSLARLLHVLASVFELVYLSQTMTKRDLYYTNVRLFKCQRASDKTLETVARMLKFPRNDLNIVASSRGRILGAISWTDENGNYVDASKFHSLGCFLPARPLRIRTLQLAANYVLVRQSPELFDWQWNIGLNFD
uniref:Spo11/DNA topoisomerase VI subunit A N-terminal domain-containing protein n=1 Tax=Rhodosorus marinus TaxID=101924 RepID=A0A7S3E9Z2_9RHOD|mmetsp:Transcript_17503/g.70907  ORF Transcript_17503/g.70907 Transcript_17503/m.70907 type:complete len:175 (+) Transcript_17503:120-644(+)